EDHDGFVTGLQVDADDGEILDDEGNSEKDYDEESEEGEGEDDDDDDEDDDVEDEEMGDVESSESEWEGIQSEDETSEIETITELNTLRNSSKPPFIQAINRSDLVMFVLDARAPESTRSLDLEQYAER